MGGTPEDKLSAEYIQNEWKKQGLDVVQMTDYDALFSYPDDVLYNKCTHCISFIQTTSSN